MGRCDVHPGQSSCPCVAGGATTFTTSSSSSTGKPQSTVLTTTPPGGPAHVPAPGSGLFTYHRGPLPGLPGGAPSENPSYNASYAAVAAAAAQAYVPLSADPASLYSGLVSSNPYT